MKHHPNMAALALAALGLSASLPAMAVDWRPDAAYVARGSNQDEVLTGTVGLAWDWNWKPGTAWSAQTEVFVTGWRAEGWNGGHQRFAQVGVLPVLRYRFGGGGSPWFVEGGIGLSYFDRLYRTPDKLMSSRFNFYDMLGVGYSFGEARRHELGLRLVHVSNAGIKKPNPGEETVQLRYAMRF